MTEIFVQFAPKPGDKVGYLITYPGIETGTVAYARVTAWLTRYPHAKVTEKLGRVCSIKIEPGVPVPDDLRWAGD